MFLQSEGYAACEYLRIAWPSDCHTYPEIRSTWGNLRDCTVSTERYSCLLIASDPHCELFLLMIEEVGCGETNYRNYALRFSELAPNSSAALQNDVFGYSLLLDPLLFLFNLPSNVNLTDHLLYRSSHCGPFGFSGASCVCIPRSYTYRHLWYAEDALSARRRWTARCDRCRLKPTRTSPVYGLRLEDNYDAV